jgi:hypothetical protein
MVLTETKLWRKGPYEKPILCNACGLHFKAKGTLDNYLPKTSQQNQLSDLDVEKESESDPELSNQSPGNKKCNKLINYSPHFSTNIKHNLYKKSERESYCKNFLKRYNLGVLL